MTSKETTAELIDGRVAIYGDPKQTFVRIAEVWSGILGVHVNPTDVPLCLAGMKLVRTQVTPDYSDNSDDVDGYMDIFRKLVGEDMVHARTTDEYLKAKAEAAPKRLSLTLVQLCIHCQEEEDLHNPITLGCQRSGFTANHFQVKL